MTPLEVVALLRELGQMFSLGEQLVDVAQQKHPELRVDPIPDEGAAMDRAREEALKR